MRIWRYLFLSCSIFIIGALPVKADELSWVPKQWPLLKGVHFEVVYAPGIGVEYANIILNEAERNYQLIADDLGYARYRSSWSWENRVKVIIFNDQQSFVEATGQPPWSQGFSTPHMGFYQYRLIVSFKDQPRFIEDVLPHEISHLILHDFFGYDKVVPLFLDEGFAQLRQGRDDEKERAVLSQLALQNKLIPLGYLFNFSLLTQKDPYMVAIFYAESLYMIDFLIKTYGKDSFREMCRLLKEGRPFEEALKGAYYPSVLSIEDLQEKWFKYIISF